MRKFPIEILLIICEFVGKTDLKCLRLVSKIFNVIIPQILFRSVKINTSPHTDDLEALQLISEHSSLRYHVQQIVYFTVYFYCPFQTVKTSKDPMIATLEPSIDTRISIIKRTFARMPKLKRLILKNHWLPPRDDPIYEYSEEDLHNRFQK
jgi:hypothetical protein